MNRKKNSVTIVICITCLKILEVKLRIKGREQNKDCYYSCAVNKFYFTYGHSKVNINNIHSCEKKIYIFGGSKFFNNISYNSIKYYLLKKSDSHHSLFFYNNTGADKSNSTSIVRRLKTVLSTIQDKLQFI